MDESGWPWVEDRYWRLVEPGAKLCRHRGCRRPAVAEINRARRGGAYWWAYCPDHLCGRRVVAGRVEVRVHPEILAAERGRLSPPADSEAP